MSTELKGKIAVVTGASRGIGKALASVAAGLGANIVLAARQEAPLKETAEELAKKYKVEVLPVACDVTKLADLENLVNKAKERFGKIDILINNAGVSSQYPFHKQPIEDFEKLAHTNYLGYVRLIRLVINDMIERKTGAIINMVSGSTLCDPLPGVTDTDLTGKLQEITSDGDRLMTTEAIENAVKFALTVPANVCPLEIAVINQKTPWTAPVIPYKQAHPDK
jgi:NADP-dependent 3-hydroxy acid dehydrogenase YdfG